MNVMDPDMTQDERNEKPPGNQQARLELHDFIGKVWHPFCLSFGEESRTECTIGRNLVRVKYEAYITRDERMLLAVKVMC